MQIVRSGLFLTNFIKTNKTSYYTNQNKKFQDAVMNGTVLEGLIVKLWNIVILVLHCILMQLTGNRVASAAQARGSYYLNYARTCSAIVWKLEKLWECWGCRVGFRYFDWFRKKRDLLTDRDSVWLLTRTALLVVWCLLSEELYMKKNYNSEKYDKM